MRKKTEEQIIKYIGSIDKTGYNTKIYKDLFSRLTNSEFDSMMKDMKNGEYMLSMIVPHSSNIINYRNNKKLLDKMGIKIFQNLTITYPNGVSLVSNIETKVLLLPNRRTKQTLSKGLAVPKDDKTRDTLTGVTTGSSNAGKITFEEIKILNSYGLTNTIHELFDVMGGDLGAGKAMMHYANIGEPELKMIDKHSTGVESTKTLKWMMASAHIKFDI